MSLKNGVVLRFGQAEVNFCARCPSPEEVKQPQTSVFLLHHTVDLTLWYLSPVDTFPDCIHVYNIRFPPLLDTSEHSQVSSLMSISCSV